MLVRPVCIYAWVIVGAKQDGAKWIVELPAGGSATSKLSVMIQYPVAADSANFSPSTFNLTINEYLTQHRVSHAQRLLATTDDKIVDIALEAGYPTLSRFYEAFKKSCGCSPSDYRREHRTGDV